MPARPVRLPAAVLLALACAGCGITNPYQAARGPAPTHARRSTTTATGGSSTSTTGGYDDPSDRPAGNYPPGQLLSSPGATGATGKSGVPVGAATAQAALARYARLDINWTAQTVAPTQRALAGISLGAARASALQAAATYNRDSLLAHSRVRNTGTVIAIAPDQTQTGVWVIVTRERTTGHGDYAGLPAQLHVTYAQVTHTTHGYVVSTWSPQT